MTLESLVTGHLSKGSDWSRWCSVGNEKVETRRVTCPRERGFPNQFLLICQKNELGSGALKDIGLRKPDYKETLKNTAAGGFQVS